MLADDLEKSIAAGDAVFNAFVKSVDEYIAKTGIEAPADTEVRTPARAQPAPTTLSLARENISAIVWATGFRNDLSWIKLPIVSDRGEPIHTRGVARPGLYFLGLRWLYKRNRTSSTASPRTRATFSSKSSSDEEIWRVISLGVRSACLWSRIASAIGWASSLLASAMPTGSMVRSARAT